MLIITSGILGLIVSRLATISICNYPERPPRAAIHISASLAYMLSTVMLYREGGLIPIFVWWIALATIITVAIADIYTHEISVGMAVFMAGIFLFYNLSYSDISIKNLFLGAICGALFFALQYIYSKGSGVGVGDIYLGASIGVLLGWPMTLYSIMFAYILGLFTILPQLITHRISLKTKVPLAPFLMISLIIFFLFGQTIRANIYQFFI